MNAGRWDIGDPGSPVRVLKWGLDDKVTIKFRKGADTHEPITIGKDAEGDVFVQLVVKLPKRVEPEPPTEPMPEMAGDDLLREILTMCASGQKTVNGALDDVKRHFAVLVDPANANSPLAEPYKLFG
jgi:hypothetical protein